MRGHRRDEPCIVRLLSGNSIYDDEPTPLVISLVGIRQTKDGALDTSENAVGLRGSKTETVSFNRTRADGPKLE